MSASWVAAQIRSRSLTSHCVGPAGAREIARSGSLERALAIVTTTSYGERVTTGQGLAESERAVFATVVWNLRVLAGWCPALGASRLHVLAGIFELTNLQGELARLEGRDVPAPFELGSLASVASRPHPATAGELRESLRRSAWGDPGESDPDAMLVALRLSLARRVVESVPEASAWAESYAALLVARVIANGEALAPDSVAAAHARTILGHRAASAASLPDLLRALPVAVAPVLTDVNGVEELWRAESRWWARLWREGDEGVRRGRAEPATVVCALAAQVADAWRVRVALETAARGSRTTEVLDAVA